MHLREPFVLEGMRLEIDASIGLALYPVHGEDNETLQQRADIAMYSAKQSGRGHAIFEPELDRHSPRRLALAGGLRTAINDGNIQLYYQPKADLRTGRIIGAEALARWDHAEFGIVGPSEFVPIAEQTGPDHAADVVRARRRDPPGARLEGRRPGALGRGQPLRPLVPGHAARGRDPAPAGQVGRRGRAARARDHREHADGRPRARRGDARAPEPDRPDALGRRLRHRLLVAGQPQAAAGGHDQDRQVLRDGDGGRRVRRRDRALHDRSRPQPRPDRRRRGRRVRGRLAAPGVARLRLRPGLLPRPPAARRGGDADDPRARHRPRRHRAARRCGSCTGSRARRRIREAILQAIAAWRRRSRLPLRSPRRGRRTISCNDLQKLSICRH